jgi:hypothetical protein
MANLTALPASARAPVVLHNHCHGLSAVDSQSRLFSDTRAGHRGFQSAMVRKLARTLLMAVLVDHLRFSLAAIQWLRKI